MRHRRPPLRRGRPGLVLGALAIFATLAAGCGSDAVQPPVDPGPVARVDAPGHVSAAILDLTGVAAVSLEGGHAFTRATPTGLRVVVVLHAPGRIELALEPLAGAGGTGSGSVTATLVEVADGDGRMVTDLGAYGVSVDG